MPTINSSVFLIFVNHVWRNQKKIEEYIRNQLQEYCNADQLSQFEPIDQLTGKPVNTGKKVPEKLLEEPSWKMLRSADIRAR